MSTKITILGCGSSGGVPRVGQGWGACDPKNPKNRRRRCSLLVERTGPAGTTRVLVDTSPDLREQLLDQGSDHLDAILMTHPHADHTNGIDDVRPLVLKAKRRITIHMDDHTASVVRRGFGYIFETPPGSGYPPLLDEARLEPGRSVVVEGPGGAIEALPFRVHHGEIDALGFRFGDVAYSPDLNAIPDASLPALENLDLWIVDALRYTRHPSHFSLEETLGWIARMRPARAILTNLHTDMDYATLAATLPAGIEPAFDGMVAEA
ncbi:Phosphoribosyl 1,2-cyclic phosphodiesterase [Beijerinckiaceae bacterium RH AL1]|nr:MBL fold metallo-hydrolase [Beijerinckiaceae bacterium]VVB45650.1 Phosphoribosyl 1,2-cyclic phosphodiesterase [Beijerinckiaceae bacterium RH CH11]VVB45725.1 Phosphoribosyl 1,2-cyclic phosphodiesterase [Beijerinckiaceae bacterium RH AL8]VVC54971.1 Phosphoribosyl 1,2-cyclic phosphodiesterase [Beijerinckiaceae bacterium RH AL1]